MTLPYATSMDTCQNLQVGETNHGCLYTCRQYERYVISRFIYFIRNTSINQSDDVVGVHVKELRVDAKEGKI